MAAFFQINRIVVHGKLACDIRPKPGLNVLQGVSEEGQAHQSNKVGKTGLIYLIQYGLGKTASNKEFHFRPIVDQINYLFLEIEGASGCLTIQRSLQGPSTAVRIYEGGYFEGISEKEHATVSIDALSDYLLKFLQIPAVRVKEERGLLTPLSFRVLMRAFFLEQRISFARLLNLVQPEQRKADIVGFLTGIYAIERFTLEEDLSAIQIELDEQRAYLSRIRAFVELQGIPNSKNVRDRLAQLEREGAELQGNFDILRSSMRATAEQAANGRLSDLRNAILSTSTKLLLLRGELRRCEGESERLTLLKGSLETDKIKVRKLRASTLILGRIEFSACPRCLQKITGEMIRQEEDGACSLCSRPLMTTSDSESVGLPTDQDIDNQLEELRSILVSVQEEILQLRAQVSEAEAELTRLQSEMEEESHEYVSPYVDALSGIAQRIAVAERAIASALGELRQLDHLSFIDDKVNELTVQHDEVRLRLQSAAKPRQDVRDAFKEEFTQTLSDLKYPDLTSCTVDPQDFSPSINGYSYIHQGNAYSALAILAYHVAMWRYGLANDAYMPSFLAIDSPAVGDMNPESETAMLDFLASLNDSIGDTHKWQIILTTRRSTEALEQFIFRKLSSPEARLLQPAEKVFGSLKGILVDESGTWH